MNRQFSLDTRKKALEMYRDGVPVDEIILRNNISRGRMYAWVREANLPHRRKISANTDQSSLTDTIDPSAMSLAERKALIDQFRISKNKTAFAAEHHIPRSTLYNWSNNNDLIQDYKGKTINMKMYYEALRMNQKQQQIIEVLHKVDCTVFSPLHVRMAALERLTDQYSEHVLCDALCVNRITFRHHLEDNKRENTWFNARRQELKMIIEDLYDEHDQIPGVDKMQALMKKKGYNVSERIVRELMHELGISSIRKNAKQIYLSTLKESNEINLKNLYPGDRPDQIWVSDFTYFRLQGKMFIVCIIMDQCSRKVLAYKVGMKATVQMLTYCFNHAITSRKPSQQLVFHSDQGCQYTSYAFKILLKENNIIQSFSRRGKPTDNPVIESFNSSFKQEALYRRDYQSVKEFKERIAGHIKYYNENRPHESLNYETPAAFEEKFL